MKKYNDPFLVVTDHGWTSEVAAMREGLSHRFGINGGTYVVVGKRDFGILGRITGFSQPGEVSA